MVDPVTQPTTTTPPPPPPAAGTGNATELVNKLQDLTKSLDIRQSNVSESGTNPSGSGTDTTDGNVFTKFANTVSGTIGEFLSKILEKQILREEKAEEERRAEREEEAEEEAAAEEAREAEEEEAAEKAEEARETKRKEEEAAEKKAAAAAAAKKAEEAAAAKREEEEKKLSAVVQTQRALISAISKNDPDAIQAALARLKSLPSVNLPENIRAQYKSELDGIVAQLKTLQGEAGRATLENLQLAYTSFLEGRQLDDNAFSSEGERNNEETTGA